MNRSRTLCQFTETALIPLAVILQITGKPVAEDIAGFPKNLQVNTMREKVALYHTTPSERISLDDSARSLETGLEG